MKRILALLLGLSTALALCGKWSGLEERFRVFAPPPPL